MPFNFCQQHTRTVLLLELNSKLRQILAKCLFPIVAQCHFDLHALAGTKEFSNRVCGLKFYIFLFRLLKIRSFNDFCH